MTKEEIKESVSMKDILFQCGLQQPDRAGFICCPFHKGDREPSMKIYAKDYHCYGCGANGDIFTFLQEYCNITFKEAFESLGGTYDHAKSFSGKVAVYKAQKAKIMRQKQEERLKEKKKLNNVLISIYSEWIRKSEPFSDVWCDCYKALEYQLYVYECLNEKR